MIKLLAGMVPGIGPVLSFLTNPAVIVALVGIICGGIGFTKGHSMAARACQTAVLEQANANLKATVAETRRQLRASSAIITKADAAFSEAAEDANQKLSEKDAYIAELSKRPVDSRCSLNGRDAARLRGLARP